MLALVESDNAEAISNRFESGGYAPRDFAFDHEMGQQESNRSSNMSVLVISKAFLSRYYGSVDQWLAQNRSTTAIIGIDDEKDDTVDLKRMSDVVLNSSEAANSVSTVARAVLSYHAKVNELAAEVKQRTSAIGNIMSGSFRFQTLAEARNLSTMLALACPRPDVAAIGLIELLINAVEHGNLEIGWDLKSKLLMEGRWNEEIEYRLNWKPYSERAARVDFRRFEDNIEVTIEDEGPGFDFEPFLNGMSRKKSPYHGRGIFFAREMAFDTIKYHGCGNKVCVSMRIEKDEVLANDPGEGRNGSN